jgi:GntR family transcriptional regulator, transcriptional repressor for pyruvate dehydrogenase complex
MRTTRNSPTPDPLVAVLEILLPQIDPKGSSFVHEQLLRRGIVVSEPTVGRMLREADRRGLTRKQGRLGRRITPTGRHELELLRVGDSRSRRAHHLMRTLQTDTLAELKNAIAARRAIDRELARAAALNATEADRSELRALVPEIRAGRETPRLLELVARAAGMPLLELVNRLIIDATELQLTVGRLLRELPNSDRHLELHLRLIESIVGRKPDAAEAAAIAHVDDILAAIEDESGSPTRKKAAGRRAAVAEKRR